MLTSTFGVIVIVFGGLAALAALEGFFVYAAARPTWKTGRGASREGLHEPPGLNAPSSPDREVASEGRVPVGAGHS